MARERRQHIRLHTERGLVQYEPLDGAVSGTGSLVDISEGGMRFRIEGAENAPAEGDETVLLVALGSPMAPLRLAGQVRFVKRASPQPGMEVAVMFTDLDERQKDFLKDAVVKIAVQKIRGEHYDRGTGSDTDVVPERRKLGAILVEQGHLAPDQLRRFMVQEFDMGARLGEQMIKKGVVEPSAVAQALSQQVGLPFVDLSALAPHTPVARRFKKADLANMIRSVLDTE